MHKIQPHQEYLDLVKEMIEHDRRYYDEFQPIISDHEYDQKMRLLKQIEKEHPDWVAKNSPTHRLHERPSKGFLQKEHMVPMYSLSNTYSEEEVSDFVKRVNKLLERKQIDFCCELKMDGVAISLTYEKGKLQSALTRGNGEIGDDVTQNMKTIPSLPLELSGKNIPEKFEVRGEVYLDLKTFYALNEEREEAGQEPFANPRNAAAGSLKLLDSHEVSKRRLNLVCYAIAEGQSPHATQMETLQYLKDLGFPVASAKHIALVHDLEGILQFIHKIHTFRPDLPFDIDGVVIKVDELKYHEILGETGKTPRYAIAYKFAPEEAHTQINDITVQVGRTGVLTPVAELEPVFLAGSTISRATLHNAEEVKRKDIRIHDSVVIEKGGDVIPKVSRVDLSKRPANSRPWKMPTHCPICHAAVVHREGEVAVRCPNLKCVGQRLRKIIHFASKSAMDIDHLGEKVAELLVSRGFVSRPSDIYLLDKDKLSNLEGFKDKSIRNLIESIDHSRNCSLSQLIMGLGVKSVGIETAELLEHHFHNLDRLMKVTLDDLVKIEGIGEKTARGIVEFFHDADNIEEIHLLLRHGVAPKQKQKRIIAGHPIEGKIFVLTGTLMHLTRDEATKRIKERGGHVSSSVSKNTDYVVVGEDAGSKLEKAKKLHIQTISESDFLKLVQL